MQTDVVQLRAEFIRSMHRLPRLYRREVDRILRRYELSEASAVPVVLIGRMGDGMRQGALAEEMDIEASTLVRLLDQLCSSGLIERHEDPADRRAKTLHLTEEGQRLAVRVDAVLMDLRKKLMGSVSPADLEATLRVFGAMEGSLAECQQEDILP
ncbi:MarR family transcriptional regulator, transcriptional regulator for hemolysin [Faunimonas pinastri]|uniref:MarR family transcriptional regulator, transcriptional regulator for hemolysin n=1 Tax=Faunimonas pinastri TaxID=1855383 RepID=A0A1H9FZY0_9HYPH|nr:MarR family transcriptional regulator [Faunimonas pinastri]SEQ43442.1 MarR family transcriptional regulator, transcriptional regulator for hemolysin [Faunimonas pinastri]